MSKNTKMSFAFGKENYMLLVAALVLILVGFMLMSGGAGTDPNVFKEEEVFSPRRITVAPIVILLGYLVGIVAILYKSKEND